MKWFAALCLIACFFARQASPAHADIVGISIPEDSDDGPSHPRNDDVWQVSAPPYPFNVNSGVGYIVNPVHTTGPATVDSDFSRHDHAYASSHVPDPSRAVITFEFDAPTAVDQIEIIQHRNGVTQLEAFVGDSLGSLVSIGSIFGPAGDNTTFNGLTEHASHVFDFNNTTEGLFLQLVVRKTNAADGWATYRVFPRLEDGARIAPAVIPEPSSLALVAVGLACSVRRMRRRNS